jgi:ribose 5-phosphate isomerase B
MKTVLIASDHAGFKLKEKLKSIASELQVSFTDLGTHSEESVDYPDYAQNLSKKLIDCGPGDHLGVLICGSGVGVSIAANRFPEIRAVLCESEIVAKLAREHNHANVLCLGEKIVSTEKAISILKTFLKTAEDFGPRHLRRIEKLGKS